MNIGDPIPTNFVETVRRLNPTVSFWRDVLIQDNADGKGPFLVAWNLPGSPPTDAEIAAAMALPPPVPSGVSPLQARKALRQSGLLDAVNAAVATAEAAHPGVTDAWQYASVVERTDPFVVTLGAQLNLTPADLDNLFRLAATL